MHPSKRGMGFCFVIKSSLIYREYPPPAGSFAHGDPARPISESLGIIEFSSQSSVEDRSESDAEWLDGDEHMK